MKKSLGLKVCAGLLVVPFLATFGRGASAVTNSTLLVGNEDIYNASTAESNADKTATYDPSSKTLTLKGYKGKAIDTDIASLTINVTEASTITDSANTTLHSTGNVTITGKALTLSNGIDIEGRFILESGNVNLGTSDLTAKGTINLNGAIKARSITLTANTITDGKIIINEKADVAVTKDITANYATSVTQKGIELNKVCANADIINLSGTGKTASTTTVFSSDGKVGVTNGVKVSSALCTTEKDEKTEKKENPDTADNVVFYVVALVASSAILAYRRYLAKR